MITEIENLPANMVGFRAEGEVTEADFDAVVMPRVKDLIEQTGKLNYLLQLDTDLADFTLGAWFKDALMGVKHLLKWNRCAIVTDKKGVRVFTDIFSVLIPGEFKGFEHSELQQAIAWTSEQTDEA